MAKQLQDGRRDLALRPNKPADPRLLAEYIVSGCPESAAQRPAPCFSASARYAGFHRRSADIAAIHGFDRKTAESIRATLDTSYQDSA